jgi:hypothetical protein
VAGIGAEGGTQRAGGRARRPVRTAIAVLVIGIGAAALAAPAAEAAPARVWLQRTDPLSTDPVRLQVAAVDADGYAAPFTGRVTLTVGRTTASVPVTSATGQEQIEVPTSALAGGSVSATAVLKVGGRTLRGVVRGIADVPPTVVLRGFGCGVITPTQKRIAWQVTRLNGRPVTWPAWTPASNTFPAYVRTVRPAVITDSVDQPLRTTGTVVVLRGSSRVATVALPSANRRLLFSVAWPGTVRGRFAPGTYTATVRLVDRLGRAATATQTVTVARSAAGLCT